MDIVEMVEAMKKVTGHDIITMSRFVKVAEKAWDMEKSRAKRKKLGCSMVTKEGLTKKFSQLGPFAQGVIVKTVATEMAILLKAADQ